MNATMIRAFDGTAKHLIGLGMFSNMVDIEAKKKQPDGCYVWQPVPCGDVDVLRNVNCSVRHVRQSRDDRPFYTEVAQTLKIVIPIADLKITTAYRAVLDGVPYEILSVFSSKMSTTLMVRMAHT